MKIGIIGAGKVGTTLGKYLSEAGICVTGFYSRTRESADEAATFTETKAYQSLSELVEASDTLFITTPDGMIQQVWHEIALLDIHQSIICHFSGSLSSHVFSGIEAAGAYSGSIHPMYAFSDKFTSYQQFHTAYLTMEGSSQVIQKMKPLFEQLGHRVLILRAEDKMKYHAAAAIASNEMLGLMQTSLDILSECGFAQKDAMELLRPLVTGNITSMLEKGCAAALTGPIERGDVQTVEKHLEALEGSEAEDIYRSLSGKMISLAQVKNPDRDYTAMKELFSLKKESDHIPADIRKGRQNDEKHSKHISGGKGKGRKTGYADSL